MPTLGTSLRASRGLSLGGQHWPVGNAGVDSHLLPPLGPDIAWTAHGMVSPPLVSSPRQFPQINNQQVYKHVKEWFESWCQWQQKILLCGLTNRCSTNQLESLSTILEPVSHRDFIVSSGQRYPSAPLKTLKARLTARMLVRKTADKSKRSPSDKHLSLSHSTPHAPIKKHGVGNVRQKQSSDISVQSHVPSVSVEEVGTLDDSIKEPTETIKTADNSELYTEDMASATTVEEFALAFATKLLERSILQAQHLLEQRQSINITTLSPDTAEVNQAEGKKEETCINEMPTNENARATNQVAGKSHGAKSESLTVTDEVVSVKGANSAAKSKDKMSRRTESTRNTPLTRQSNVKTPGARSSRSKLSGAKSSESMWASIPVHRISSSGRSLGRSAGSTTQSLDDHWYSHRHQSAVASPNIHGSDFFVTERRKKLGGMQAEMRTGRVHRPIQLQDLYVPIQKLYKNVKWWAASPTQGKVFVKPHRNSLKLHFRKQIKEVWNWMHVWQDHERLALLGELVKLCEPSLVSYLHQCIVQRLKERIDINWLPDKLLLQVFSHLSCDDIESAAQVCRRWGYLCAQDQLWMNKCEELGVEQGIPDIINIVLSSSKDDLGIDWKMAFYELRNITEDAKQTVPVPDKLTFEIETPDGMARVGHKFVPIAAEESDGSSKQLRAARSKPAHRSMSQEQTEATLKALEQHDTLQDLHAIPQPASDPELTRQESDKKQPAPQSKAKKPQSLGSDKVESSQRIPVSGPEEPDFATKAAGPLRTWPRRKQKDDDEEDVALDIRPTLVQAQDLVGLSKSSYNLQWRPQETLDRHNSNEKFGGVVKGVKRVRKLQGHMDSVLCVKFDERRVISGSLDRTIRIWDIRSGRSIHKLYGHKGGVSCLQFENELLISGSWDTSLMVWDIIHFRRLAVLTGHRGSVSCMQFDDRYIVSGSHDGTVRVWSKQTFMSRGVITGHKAEVTALGFDGTHVISGSVDRTLRMTDVETCLLIRVMRQQMEPITSVMLVGGLVLGGNMDGQVFFWNKTTGDMEAGIQAHPEDTSITVLTFHEGRFFTACSDGTIKEWDLVTMTCVRSLQGHKGPVQGFEVSAKRMVSCSSDGNIRVWDLVSPIMVLGNQPSDVIGTEMVAEQ